MTNNQTIIEKKFYRENSSPQIISAIENRVSQIGEDIILFLELPRATPFSVKVVFEKITRLAEAMNNCAYLIDISDAGLPTAVARRALNTQFQNCPQNVKHISFITEKNFIINTAVKFVMYQSNLDSFSISKTKEQAVSEIRKVLNTYSDE